MGISHQGEITMSRGISVEAASASAQLQTARVKSAQDGMWRIVLTPNNSFGKMLKDTIEAIGGSRTETFESGGKVSVTSSSEPFGTSDAILIVIGKWDTAHDLEILRAWREHCNVG